MKKFLLVWLLMLGIASCVGGPLTFAVDTEFTEDERSLIISAIDEWVIATDSDDAAVFLRFDLVQDEPFDKKKHWDDYDGEYGVVYKIHTYEHGYKQWVEEREKEFTGIAHGPDKIAMVAEKSEDPYVFRKVFMHELGHIYGIGHQDSGLMKPNPEDDCIDALTLHLFCEEHYCGPNAAPTCKADE